MSDSVDLREVARRWLAARADIEQPSIEHSVVRGTTSATLRITTESSSYVLKLFDNPTLIAAMPDIASREATGLRCASQALGKLVPEVIAVASEHSRDLPTGLLMTELPGKSDMSSPNLDGSDQHIATICGGTPPNFSPSAPIQVVWPPASLELVSTSDATPSKRSAMTT